MDIRQVIIELFNETLENSGFEPLTDISNEMILLKSGLDSLGFAILIAKLEHKLGYDPFSLMDDPYYPQNFHELVAIYEKYGDRVVVS